MEVDRLTLMIDVATRAERMRETYRVLRARRQPDGSLASDKDTLDWLKFAQSETDGVKLDISRLLAAEDATASGDDGNRLLPSQHVGAGEGVTNSGTETADSGSGSDGPSSLSLPVAPTGELDHVGQPAIETDATSTSTDIDHLAQPSSTTPNSE